MSWEPVVGLEIHVQLSTRTKMFCGCEVSFGDPPNVHTCSVCLGLPGSLPVAKRMALASRVLGKRLLTTSFHSASFRSRSCISGNGSLSYFLLDMGPPSES